MEEKLPKLASALRQTDGGHILYLSEKEECYINNALVFILDGIRNGDYVFMIENPRLTPHICRRLEQLVTEDELKSVKFANNFEFYWNEGNFLPLSIIQYFEKTLNIALQEGKFFRTWGHIEWGSQEDFDNEILVYDKHASQFISEHKFFAVCAYNASRVSKPLQQQLRVRHSYLMTDNQIDEVCI